MITGITQLPIVKTNISFKERESQNRNKFNHYYINHSNPFSYNFDQSTWRYDNNDARKNLKVRIGISDDYYANPIEKLATYDVMCDKNFDILNRYGYNALPFLFLAVSSGWMDVLDYIFSDEQKCRDLANLKYNDVPLIDFANDNQTLEFLIKRGAKGAIRLQNEYEQIYQKLHMQNDARNISAKLYADNPIKVSPAQMQPRKARMPEHYYINNVDPQNPESDSIYKYSSLYDTLNDAFRMHYDLLTDIRFPEYRPDPTSELVETELLRDLISMPNTDILEKDDEGTPTLVKCIHRGQLSIIKFIFDNPKHCKDLINYEYDGKKLLNYATTPDVRRYLIAKGAQLSKTVDKAVPNPTEIKHYYINHADPQNPEYTGFAWKYENEEYLFEKRKEINKEYEDKLKNDKNFAGYNPDDDKQTEEIWILRKLIFERDTDLLEKEFTHKPPLLLSYINDGYLAAVRYIFEDPKRCEDLINFEYEGKKLLDYVETPEMWKYLRKKGAQPSENLVKIAQLPSERKHYYVNTKTLKDFDILNTTQEIEDESNDLPLLFKMVHYIYKNPFAGYFGTNQRDTYIQTVKEIFNDPNVARDLVNLCHNGHPLLDYAGDSIMKDFLISKGAKPYELMKEIRSDLEGMEIPKKQTITVNQITETKAEKETPQEIKSSKDIDFFEALENLEEQAPVVKTQKTKEIKGQHELPEQFKNYTILKISENDPKSLDDIIGMSQIKKELNDNVIIPMNEQSANEVLKANNIDIPNGILIESAQDTTNLVKALSNETGMPVLQLLNPQELKPMLNDIEQEFTKNGNKTIVLIRDFDKFFTTGAHSDIDKKNFIMDIENCKDKGALLFATVDDKSVIDPKFINLRIFDKVMDLKIPNYDERKETLSQYFSLKQLFKSLNTEDTIKEFAEKTEGFNYPDIEKVLEESARVTVARGKDSVDAETIREELSEFTKQAGITPIDDFNKTAMYDTPEFKRIPVEEGEMMSLDELGGMSEIKEQLRDLYVRPLQNLEALQAEIGSAAIPDGAIFYGPAGNGKTLTAKVLARELGLPYYETKLSDIGTALVHEEPKAIKKMAQQLNDKFRATGERSVWFLDEFDSLGGERTGASQHNKELTDALLQEFTNPASRGFILIAATNDLDGVDAALKRRGRLGNWIGFTAPDFEARYDVIKKTLAKTPRTAELSNNEEFINKVSKELDGLSMASITAILSDAKRLSIMHKKDFKECIKSAIDAHVQREMGEFCNKAGLKAHQYNEWDFKSLDELGGMEEVKQKLQENVIDIWDPEVRAALLANKRSLSGGVILEGPPGTGKTTIVETLARQMGIPLYKMNYQQEGNEYIHGVARNVSEIFERLKLESKIIKKPVMLFFDEAEKFFPRHAERHQIEEVNTYKDLMNTAAASGIILVAATNHIHLVNQEIIGNPRRMGTVIHVGNPGEKDRKNLLSKLLKDLPIITAPVTSNIIDKLATQTEGYSVGQIADAIDKFITQAVKKKQNIEPESLLKAITPKVKL